MVTGPAKKGFLENLQALEEQRSVCEDLKSQRDKMQDELVGLDGDRAKELAEQLSVKEGEYHQAIRRLRQLHRIFEQGPKVVARKRNNGK